jgi:A nuclease family of the HNH/ENDO VII superfamily with conserved AHH
MTARVLLWADRAAFALGTVTSVLREHRSWLVEQFGAGFMDAVDTIHSATAIYGLARVALETPRIIFGLRNSYRVFREAARSRSSGFSSAEQATIQQVTQSTDELIEQIDNIQGALPPARPSATEPATRPALAESRPTEPVPAGRRGISETHPERASSMPEPATERGRAILEEFSEAARRGRPVEQPEGTHAVGERINPPTTAGSTDADILAANLTRELGTRPPGHHAHHIVPKGMAEAESAWDILEWSHIGINDAENGVWLARDYGTPNPLTGEIHSTLHTQRYVRWVTSELTEAYNRGGPAAVRGKLAELRDIILNGRAIR